MLDRIRDEVNSWLTVILKLGLLIIIACSVIWFGISIGANIFEGDATTGIPKMPDITKAQYTVLLKTTGEVLLTSNYDENKSAANPNVKSYVLHGFYRVIGNKWKAAKNDLLLDEYYFGEINIERRLK